MKHSSAFFYRPWAIRLCLLGILSLGLSGCDLFGGGGGGGGTSGPQTVLVMGDSISARGTYIDTQPWPSIVQGENPEWTVANRAVAGETSGGGLSRISNQLDAVKPDVTVIYYGANDAIQRKVGEFEGNLVAMIRACQLEGSRVAVCTVAPFAGQRVVFQGNVDAINDIIRTVGSRLGATVIRIDAEFAPNDRSIFPDGLHPNQTGQTIIALTIEERI